jgi:hypothetical protein
VTRPLPGPQLPWPANRRPLSVVAFGNSVASLMMPERSDRGEGTYVEVMADLLTGEGVPTTPHLQSVWFDFLHEAMRDYATRVRAHAPDVLVVQFGLNEYQPWLAPVWLIRHLMAQNQGATRTAKVYQRQARWFWKHLRTYRRWAAPKVRMRTWQTTPRRFEGQLHRLLNHATKEAKPLVLVLDIDHPGERLEHFLPGMAARHAVFQDLLARVVADRNDPDVRLFRVSELTASLGPEASADAMHYTAATHYAVGCALTAEVISWLKERGER